MISEYRTLFLLVEGSDDARFCREVLIPIFRRTFDDVRTWEYSRKKPSKTVNFIRNIGYMNADYILFGDMDRRPCVTSTKEDLATQFPVMSWDRVVVIRRMIEAWYLAGISEASHRNLALDRVRDIEEITKDQFNDLVGGSDEHSNSMIEILKYYDVEVARQRSPSFRYFWQKHVE